MRVGLTSLAKSENSCRSLVMLLEAGRLTKVAPIDKVTAESISLHLDSRSLLVVLSYRGWIAP